MIEYPDKDFPWNFYFNGELMPKWAACWDMAEVGRFVQPERDACEDVSDRDIYIIMCMIDHVGVVESADPDIFLYAAQEVLYLHLYHRDRVLASIAEHPRYGPSAREVFSGLVEGAFRMRQLTLERGCAFWTSGYDTDGQLLLEAMRRSAVPPGAPDYEPPPHVSRLRALVRHYRNDQVPRLHRLAQSGRFDKELRKKLHEIQPD